MASRSCFGCALTLKAASHCACIPLESLRVYTTDCTSREEVFYVPTLLQVPVLAELVVVAASSDVSGAIYYSVTKYKLNLDTDPTLVPTVTLNIS